MKLLIIDQFNTKRDRTPLDMYKLFNERYETDLADNGVDAEKKIKENNYDILWLGVYHQYMDISIPSILDFNSKPVIIDQTDNEGFITENKSYHQADNIKLLSRCLPHDIEKYWGRKVYLIPRYIDPSRYKVMPKTIDVVFVCSIYGTRLGRNRIEFKKALDQVLTKTDLTYITAEVWDTCYFDLIARSKAMIIDGSRDCMTCKYLEASISECVIIGEKPHLPENKIRTIEIDYSDADQIIKAIQDTSNVRYNKDYVLDTFANKDYFFNQFEKLL